MRQAGPEMPAGRHFALTWGIPENYGGMTSAMLHRSRAFVRMGGVCVDVLTVDDRPDYPALEERMRASGELLDGMALRNVWDDLRERLPEPAARQVASDELLRPRDGDVLMAHDGVLLMRERRAESGAFGAADRFRRNGTLLATDRLVRGTRRIVVYDEAGVPVRSWGSSWKLFHWWLDRLTEQGESCVIVDSKTAARFVAGYRRSRVITMHLVHGGHRRGDEPGTLRASRGDVLRRAADFDAVVFLTARQRDEFLADGFGGGARLPVIPNGVFLDAAPLSSHRREDGVILASLTARKRIDHAVRAVLGAQEENDRIRLDVYGEGPDEQSLRRLLNEAGSDGRIGLHGFQSGASRRFRGAGFSLLTSTSEGLPLVLAEAMAAGCLPIVYDIRYGPADLVEDGVNGFLVSDGDVDAMTQRILALQDLPEVRVEEMRRAARERAEEFSDEVVVAAWGREMARASSARRSGDAPRMGAIARTRYELRRVGRRLRSVLAR